jgi:hypothetical protein
MLHSFWWQEGENAFRAALEADPNCAIAAWGIATILISFGLAPFAQVPLPQRLVCS